MDSNHRPAGYESAALTAELRRRAVRKCSSGFCDSSASAADELDSLVREVGDAAVGHVDRRSSTPARARSEAAIELRLPIEQATANWACRSARARPGGRSASSWYGTWVEPSTWPSGPLVVVADVEEAYVAGAQPRRPGRGMSTHGDRLRSRVRRRATPAMPAGEEPADLRKPTASSRRPSRRASSSVAAVTTTSARGVDDPGGPRADGGADHRHVDRARDMVGVELARIAAVDERRALVEELLHARGREGLDRGRLREERPAVQLDDAREVRRLCARGGSSARGRTRPRSSSFARRL